MRRTVRAILWLSFLFLYGCSASHDVVRHGPFQTRKYGPGQQVDIGRVPKPTERTALHREDVHRMATTPCPPVEQASLREPLTASVNENGLQRTPPERWTPRSKHGGIPSVAPLVRKVVATSDEQSTDGPRRWNRMALVSGAFLILALLVAATGGGGIIGLIFTFSILTGIIGLLLAIKHNERGKGIAIAAIAIPVAILVAAVLALNAG